jgi:hypothetical protein
MRLVVEISEHSQTTPFASVTTVRGRDVLPIIRRSSQRARVERSEIRHDHGDVRRVLEC